MKILLIVTEDENHFEPIEDDDTMKWYIDIKKNNPNVKSISIIEGEINTIYKK